MTPARTHDPSCAALSGPVTCGIAVSVDGFVAGPRQSLDDPIGEGGRSLHRWMFEQPDSNAAELDALASAGAFIMGRNMFGPGCGAWDEAWRGWWGDEPPCMHPCSCSPTTSASR